MLVSSVSASSIPRTPTLTLTRIVLIDCVPPESLVYGNETPESATELLQAVLTPFTSVLGAKALAASQHPAPRCVRLPTGELCRVVSMATRWY